MVANMSNYSDTRKKLCCCWRVLKEKKVVIFRRNFQGLFRHGSGRWAEPECRPPPTPCMCCTTPPPFSTPLGTPLGGSLPEFWTTGHVLGLDAPSFFHLDSQTCLIHISCYGGTRERSVSWRISSRLRNELVLKDVGGQYLHSDAVDRLHLRWCGSQKSTESRQAVLGREMLQKRAAEPQAASR